MRRHYSKNGLWIVLIWGLLLPIVGGVTATKLFPEWQWINPPFLALLKLVSGILAVTLGWLVFQREQRHRNSPYFWVGCSLVSMGLLDIVHAGVPIGQLSIWLHSTTACLGGLLFLLIYTPHASLTLRQRRVIFLFVALGTGTFGVVSLMFPQLIPMMIDDGTFTSTTRVLTLLGSVGFFLTAWFFIHRSSITQAADDRFFAILCSVFGCASLLFSWSTLWNAAWWWWHAIRLVAYGTGLQYVMSFSTAESVNSKPEKSPSQTIPSSARIHMFRLPLGRAANWLPLLVVAVVVITFAVGATSLYLMQQRLIQTEGEALAIAAVALAERVDRTLYERMGDIKILAENPVLLTNNRKAITRYLIRLQQTYEAYHWIGVTDAKGVVIAATYPDTVGLDFGGFAFFKAVQAYRSIQIQDAQPSKAFNMTITVPFGVPLLGPNGDFRGTVFAHVGLPNLEILFARTLQSFQREGENLEFQLLTKKGIVIVDSLLKEVGRINLLDLNLPSAVNVLNSQSGWIMEEHLRRQVPVITGYAPTHGVNDFQELGWGILVRRTTEQLMKPIYEIQWKVGGAGLIVALPLVGLLIWSTGRLQMAWRLATESEQAIAQLHRQNQLLLDSVGDGIYGLDLNGKATFVNPAATKMLGYKMEELIGVHMHSTIHHSKPDQTPYFQKDCPIYASLQHTEIPHGGNEVYWRKDGTHFPVDYTSTPIRDEFGKLKGAVVTFKDITERKQAEEQIQSLAKFPEENPSPVLRISKNGIVTYTNPASRELLQEWKCDVGNLAPTFILEMVTETLTTGLDKIVDIQCSNRFYSLHIAPIQEGGYVNLYAKDITERRQAEETLLRYTEELRRSNAELEQFAFVASHDLQEPLRKIRNFTELLVDRAQEHLPPQTQKFLTYIVEGATRMQTLIQDLLAYSRVARGQFLVQPIDVHETIERVLSTLQPTITKSECTVTVDTMPIVTANPSQMEQLFQNLIGNAIKYRGRESPKIYISASEKIGHWQFSVRDNGIGIDPEFAERIFVIFQRLHTMNEYSGTGIGLAICKKIVERHGGEIWVESQVGLGSTFFFTIPNVPPPVSYQKIVNQQPDRSDSIEHSEVVL